MANFETKLNVNDIVVVINYLNEIGTGIVKSINITSSGITYDVVMGFVGVDKEHIIKLYEEETDSKVYKLVRVVGNLDSDI